MMRGWFRDAWENGLQKAGYVAIDSVAMAIAYLMATLFRYDFQEPLYGGWPFAVSAFGIVWAVQLLFLFLFGCYRMMWRFVSVSDIPRFVGALSSATLALALLRYGFPELRWLRPPYGVTLMNGFLALGGLLSVRILGRILLGGDFSWRLQDRNERVLLVGAGNAGNLVARELQHLGPRMPHVVGFLDDDASKQGASILGFRVLGRIGDLRDVVRKLQVSQVIVTMTRVSREVLRAIVKDGEAAGVPVRIISEYGNALGGKVMVSRIRQVEVSDLLGRVESAIDSHAEVALLGNKRVMVTGAGGSIGSELVRQIAQCGPEMILLVERSEFALYAIDRELRVAGTAVRIVPLMADIGDETRMRAIFDTYSPQIVIHAAAHKHVPMMERNPGEAVKNNVLATRRLGEMAVDAGVERFVLISTDKAVNPISVMGMTKRFAEVALQDLNRRNRTRFTAVRFGNVLDSSGSVVPLFRKQIHEGGPVTVTHPEMKRYFMTISEAVSLVLQATVLAKGGEIFVLDMGEPVKIVELAEEMITLSGLRPYTDIPIEFIGIRPGEKLFEELDVSERSAYKTGHARIFISKLDAVPEEQVQAMLQVCRTFAGKPDRVDFLHEWIARLDGREGVSA